MNRRFIFFKKIYTLSLICVSGLFSSTDVFAKITEEMLQNVLSFGAALSLNMDILTSGVIKYHQILEKFCHDYAEDFAGKFSFESSGMKDIAVNEMFNKHYIQFFNALSKTQDVLQHLSEQGPNWGGLSIDSLKIAYRLYTYAPLWLLSSKYFPKNEVELERIRFEVEQNYYLKAIKMQESGAWAPLKEALAAGPEPDPRTSIFSGKFKEGFFNLAKGKGILPPDADSRKPEMQDLLCRALIKCDTGLLPTLAFWREHQLVVALDCKAKCEAIREQLSNVKEKFLTVIGNNQHLTDPSKKSLNDLFCSQGQMSIYLLAAIETLHAKNEILQQENNQKSATINRLQMMLQPVATTHLPNPPQTPPNARNIPGSVDAPRNGATRLRSASLTGRRGSAQSQSLLGSPAAPRGGNSSLLKDSPAATPVVNPPLAAAATSQQQETTSSEEIGKALEQLIPIFEGMSKKFEQNTEELNKLVIEYTSH